MSLPGLRGWFTPNMFCGFSIVFLCKHAIDGHLWPRLLWLASFVMSSSWLQVQFITTLSLWCDLFMMCYYNILWYYFTHPQAIRWVSSWEQIWRNVALLKWMWMGAVRMRVQTARFITIIHTTPVHQLTSWEVISCMFVRSKSIKMF